MSYADFSLSTQSVVISRHWTHSSINRFYFLCAREANSSRLGPLTPRRAGAPFVYYWLTRGFLFTVHFCFAISSAPYRPLGGNNIIIINTVSPRQPVGVVNSCLQRLGGMNAIGLLISTDRMGSLSRETTSWDGTFWTEDKMTSGSDRKWAEIWSIVL